MAIPSPGKSASNAPAELEGAAAKPATIAPPPAPGFRLVRYFTVASLAAFVLVGATLLYFNLREGDFFLQVQQEQNALFAQMQDGFAKRYDAAAHANLLRSHEAVNVNLTRLLANALWEKDFAPFVAKAQRIPVDRCRAIADVKDAGGKTAQPAGKKACYAGIGRQIMAFPEFRALDAKVFDMMIKSTVFKIKVYDLRGITVYSSEHNQIGEDKIGNAGWQSAVAGKPASELIHRDTFSAFEGVVENRDLIEIYIPILAPGSEKIAAVFEVYSDVTQLLDQIKASSAQFGKLRAENQAKMVRAVAANQDKIDRSVNLMLAIVLGLLALLYCALFLIVRHGQRVIDRQDSERKRAGQALRESEAQFRGVVEQPITGIYIVQDGKFAYVNPRLAEILGYDSADDLIGRAALSVVAEKDRGIVAENIRRRIGGETPSIGYSFSAQRKDGSMIDIGVHGAGATYRGGPAIIGLMQDITEKKRAEDEIKRYVARLENTFMSTVEIATTLSEMRDPYTAGHERRVGAIAAAIGAELGFDARRAEGLLVAGYLHDIGKITIPVEILVKPGMLSFAEFTLIKGHAQASYDILKNVEFPWPVAEVALQHHERLDGSGYPQGLKGAAILLEARIMAVADVVEAMSSHRPYRPGLGIDKALAEIERGRGTLYDTEAADACLRLFREKSYSIPA